MPLEISRISAAQTFELRHKVLWPDRAKAHCILEGDEAAVHFGGSVQGELVSVVSVFSHEHQQMRLRKFAILPEFQGRGYGSSLINHIIDYLEGTSTHKLWCDARQEAIPFYLKQGFVEHGDAFLKSGVSYIRMYRHLKNAPNK